MGFITLFSFSQFYPLPNFTGDSCESCYDNTDVFNHLICLGQFVCWPISILDSQLFDVCRVFVFSNSDILQMNSALYYMLSFPPPDYNTQHTQLRYLSKWNFQNSPAFFLTPTPIFSALSCFKTPMKPLSGHHGGANFRFDHQVYNIG